MLKQLPNQDKLSGAQLDKWVAKAENIELDEEGMAVKQDGMEIFYQVPRYVYSPSTMWGEGGPIIEREGISVNKWRDGSWVAIGADEVTISRGKTPLEAAMRRYIGIKFGEEVEDD